MYKCTKVAALFDESTNVDHDDKSRAAGTVAGRVAEEAVLDVEVAHLQVRHHAQAQVLVRAHAHAAAADLNKQRVADH